MNHILCLHAVSSSGRNVTVAVICLMTALIPLLMSSELFCLGLLKKEMNKNVAVTFKNIFMQKTKTKNKMTEYESNFEEAQMTHQKICTNRLT